MKRIGTETKLDDNERAKLLDELRYWHRLVADPKSSIAKRREMERAFYCIWKGQNAAGVRKNEPGQLAWPFEGASDQRLRWGEQVYHDLMAYTLVAISQCETEIVCGGDQASIERARALKRLLSGVEESLGAKGLAEIKAMFHYMYVDSPAVGALDIGWKKRRTLGVVEIDADELQAEYAAAAKAAGEAETDAAVRFRVGLDAVASGAKDDPAAVAVAGWLENAKKLVREDIPEIMAALSTEGECECRAVVESSEGPELQALRYGEDFCIPTVSRDFDYASPIFRSEWITKAKLMERVGEEGWDRDWAEETMNYAGFDLFNEWATAQFEEMKDLVNLVWCYQAETNERGETTRYVTVLSHADGSAFGRRVMRSRRGKWDMAFFRREVRNSNILDGRGLAELCSPAQGMAKNIRDMAADNAIVGSLPAIKAKGARVKNVLLEPFAVINMGQSDDLTFMQPPAFPAAADKQEEKIKNEVLDYFGIPRAGGPDTTDRRMELTDWILRQWRDFLVMLLECAQDNASDDYIARVTQSGDLKGLRSQDVSGEFSIVLKLDPRNLDNGKLIEKMKAVGELLLGMDRSGTVDTDPLVRHCMTMLFPEMSGASLKSPEAMVGMDIEAEKQNFVLIKSGIMPKMDTTGKWNYGARLQFYRELQEQNPAAIQDMTPTAQAMLFEQWIPALEQQQTQFGDNAEIGRTGVEGVQT